MTSPNPITDDITVKNNPKSNPQNNFFILGNIALIAGVPWLLVMSMAGLAVGDPVFPAWFEIFILGFPAIALVTWVQWQQPFSPFSLWVLAKPPESLSESDRRILTLIKQNSNGWYTTGWMAIAVAVVTIAMFCKIYVAAPLAEVIAPFPSGLRLFGIIWAEFFFLLSNVLLQSGISNLRVLLTDASELNNLQPFTAEKVKNSFTNIGWRSPELLKFFEEEAIVFTDPSQEENSAVADEQTDADLEINDSDESVETLLEQELEQEAIADNPEEPIAELEPIEITQDATGDEIIQNSEELTSLELTIDPDLDENLAPTEIVLDTEASQPDEVLEPLALILEPEIDEVLDTETTSEPETEEPDLSQVSDLSQEPNAEITSELLDINLDEQVEEEGDELEISEIIAEESLVDEFSEDEVDQSVEIIEVESLLEGEIAQESEDLDESLNVFVEPEVETSLEPILEIKPEAIASETISEQANDQLVEEAEELEISEIVAEESLVEVNLEPTEVILAEETIQESEEVNPLENIEEALVEAVLEPSDPIADSEVVADISETKINLASETDISSTEIVSGIPETELRVEQSEELEIEAIASEESLTKDLNNTAQSPERKALDFLKKTRKSGISQKKHGFGKSVKRHHNVESSPENTESDATKISDQFQTNEPVIAEDAVEIALEDVSPTISELEIINEGFEKTEIEAIAAPIEQELVDDKIQDFDDELDELIAFNNYVENILQEYLEDADEETENTNADDISASIVTDEAVIEAIATDNVQTVSENLPDLETPVSQDSSEEISNDQAAKDSKYLVQEFLVDKFLARLEELNNVDKSNKAANEQPVESSVEPNPNTSEPNIDEFADLEALLDRKLFPENSAE